MGRGISRFWEQLSQEGNAVLTPAGLPIMVFISQSLLLLPFSWSSWVKGSRLFQYKQGDEPNVKLGGEKVDLPM
jgi:hypothetical protein